MTTTEKVTTHFQIDGMTCGGCASRIERALQEQLPAVAPELDVPGKRLVATYDPTRVAVSQIVSVVSEAGYTAKPL